MSSLSTDDIRHEFGKSVLGIIGIIIISSLIMISVITAIVIPASTFQEWNNPEKWLDYPKTSIPIWMNYFTAEKTPEHKIIPPNIIQSNYDNVYLISQQFFVDFEYDDFPNDFVYEFETRYSNSHLVSVNLIRPDGIELHLLTTTIPFSENETIYKQRIFSTDAMIKKNIMIESDIFAFDISKMSVPDIVF